MTDIRLEPGSPAVCSPRIQALLDRLPDRDVLEAFWREATTAGTPMIEDRDDGTVLVTFLWRGTAESTRVWWGVNLDLTRIPGTDLWYGSQALPADLRTIYCFHHGDGLGLPHDATGSGASHIDAHNRTPLLFPGDPTDPTDRDCWLSVLELPQAPPDPWSHPQPGVPTGRLTRTVVPSPSLGDARPVVLYQPAGTPTTGLPALVVFDGHLSREVLRIPTTLDNLIAARRVPPTVALFVDTRDSLREQELIPASPITDFVTHDLMPWAHQNTATAAAGNLIAGSSRGGLVAADIALRAPHLFAAVISQSGSFWWPTPDQGEPGRLIRDAARKPRADLRWYLDVGSREDLPGPAGTPSQVDVNRQMRDALHANGYPVHYTEYTGAHDYINWRRTFADGLIAVRRG